jgi:mannose-1-phosphate guanylyltransferase / mannose-6-phosphate isomerase
VAFVSCRFPQAISRFIGHHQFVSAGVLHASISGAPDIAVGNTLVVTNEEHRFLSLEQLREIKGVNATLLLEPIGRNTPPALMPN